MVARFLPLVVGAFLACSATAGAEKAKPKLKPTSKPLTEEQVRQTLERIIIPRLSFREASFREVIVFLRKEAQRLDPKKRGIDDVTGDSAGLQSNLRRLHSPCSEASQQLLQSIPP